MRRSSGRRNNFTQIPNPPMRSPTFMALSKSVIETEMEKELNNHEKQEQE